MVRANVVLALALGVGGFLRAADGDVVFRSDVSLVRVDAQVLDRGNRTIAGLRAEDFVLLDEGLARQIRNFAREDMPLDVALLLDVSRSMRPHVERITSASRQAMYALGKDDRVAVLVFDRSMRVRLPFRSDRQAVEQELERMLSDETFDGDTDITRALVDAAGYVGRAARRDARKAIVIVTDDQTEFERDEKRVSRALVKADAVLSALIAPDAMRSRRAGMGGGDPGRQGGGQWPGNGPTIGGPLGGIIFGRRGGYGGRRPGTGGPYPGGMGPRTRSAGTSEIARDSGGDSMPVDDASALETTLSRLRQRYALHFLAPEGAPPGEERTINVELADAARRRYPDAQVRFRRFYITPPKTGGAMVASAQPAATQPAAASETAVSTADPVIIGPWSGSRRPAVDEPSGPRGPNPVLVDAPASTSTASQQSTKPAENTAPAPTQGGWRRLKPGEQP
ncbi:MAG: VWA domain-containing protein [Acidobacteriales bacterium]|nr:VWA domain-containing protein [Terriglobales bacterium]